MTDNKANEILLSFGIDNTAFQKVLKGISDEMSKIDWMGKADQKIGPAAAALSKVKDQVKLLKEELKEGGLSLVEIERKTKSFDNSVMRLTVRLEQLRDEMNADDADFKELTRNLGSVTAQVDRLG